MDFKEAVSAAKRLVADLYSDENLTNVALEEVAHVPAEGTWVVTLSLTRPWGTPRTRAQEVLEHMGAVTGVKRAFKVVTMSEDGTMLSMKDRIRADAGA